jgi:hypothetical protein
MKLTKKEKKDRKTGKGRKKEGNREREAERNKGLRCLVHVNDSHKEKLCSMCQDAKWDQQDQVHEDLVVDY